MVVAYVLVAAAVLVASIALWGWAGLVAGPFLGSLVVGMVALLVGLRNIPRG